MYASRCASPSRHALLREVERIASPHAIKIISITDDKKDFPVLDATSIRRLATHINRQEALNEEDIELARRWVDDVARFLLGTKRSAYQNAINHLILVAESRELLRGANQA